LDDYHLIENPVVHQAISFLLDHLPPQMQLVISSRSDPPLNLARMRLSEMLALGLDDLDLAVERAIVRGSKPGHDRVVFLTPVLIEALNHYLEKRPELPDENRVFVLRGR
jgi:integrase